MHYLFADEAGTSAVEPVSVVAAVIAPDNVTIERARLYVNDAYDRLVPPLVRKGFVFHGKEVFSGTGIADKSFGWTTASRVELFKAILETPRRFGLAVSFGICRREAMVPAEFKDSTLRHMIAFAYCLGRADHYSRFHGFGEQRMRLVAEDQPEMKRRLQEAALKIKTRPIFLPPEHQRPTAAQIAAGTPPLSNEHRLESLELPFVFAKKSPNIPLLHVADAAAFALRRCFAELSFGEDLVEVLLGNRLHMPDWEGPGSAGLFYFHASRQAFPPGAIVFRFGEFLFWKDSNR